MNTQVENNTLQVLLSKIFAPFRTSTNRFLPLALLAMAVFFAGNTLAITKAATGTDLTVGASWTGNSAPSSGDTATWITGSLGPGLTLTSGQAWLGITVTNASGAVGITGSGTLTLGAGGMDLSASAVDLTIASPVALSSTQDWKINTSRTLTASGNISGTSYGLSKLGSGTLILSGVNSYTGPTTITLGTLQIGNNGTSGSLSPSSTISNNGTLNFNRTDTLTQGTDFASVISGSGQLSHSGSGTVILNSNNTYTGQTTLKNNNSVLSINSLKAAGSTCSLGQGNQINLGSGSNGGTLRYTGTGDGIDGEGTTDRVINFSGNSSRTKIEQAGSGLLKFTSATTVTGGTQAKTLELIGSSTGVGELAGAIQNGTDVTQVLNLSKTGTGTWVLSGDNTYTGTTTLQGGTLVLAQSSGFSSGTGGFVWDSAGTLQINAPVTISNNVTATGNSNHGYITGSNSVTFTGVITGNKFTIHNTSTGTLTFTNGIVYLGSTNAGIFFSLGAGATGPIVVDSVISDWSGGSFTNSGEMRINEKNDGTYGYDIGTVTLNANNTYTSPTTVNNGKLIVNGTINSTNSVTVYNSAYLIVNGSLKSNSVVTVNNSAYLGGTGTVNGAVSLLTTSGIDLRNSSAGILTLSTNLTISGAAGANKLYFDLGTGGTGDKITVSGNTAATTDGAGVINLNQLSGPNIGGIGAGTYDLITTTGSMAPLSKFVLATPGAAFGKTYTLQLDPGTSKKLQVVVAGGSAGPAAAHWKGGNNNWSTTSDWNTDATSNIGTDVAPGYDSNVSFYTTTPAAGNLTSGVLDADFEINSLSYTAAAIANTTIGGTTKTLTLRASSANGNTLGNGITLSTPSSGTPTHTISAKVGLGTNQTWTVNSGAALTVSGGISDFGYGYSLAKTGAGTLTLSGANTFSGGLYIKAGTVKLGNLAGAGNAAGTIYLGDADTDANVTLSININSASMNANPISVVAGNAGTATLNFTPGGNTGYVNGLITLNNHDLIVTATANQNQIKGGITGTGNLTFTQSGTLINLAAGTINTIGNITFSHVGTSGMQILTTDSLNNTGTITNNSTSTGAVTITAPIGSNVTAIVQNSTSSKMILSGANTSYSGTTTVSAGTLEIGTSSSLGAASSVIIASGAKMNLNFSGTNTVKSLKLGISFKTKGVYNVTTDPAYFDAAGAGSLNVTTGPSAGTMVRFF